jgi:hypothetical protein
VTYDQLIDLGIEQDRLERMKTAEAQILDQLADLHCELMANGEICTRCGEEFREHYGAPTMCVDCGGVGQVRSWYAGGRYFADEANAREMRRIAREKRSRHARRVARFFGEGDAQ